MKKVAVVDYGMGNLRSVTQAVMHVASDAGVEVVWARTPAEVLNAERVVLPGQGGMRDCMHELHAGGMCQTAATSILCIVTMPDRLMRATVQARRTTADAFPVPLRAIIFLQPNFTLKKAQRTA